jgi:hypothetical protein
MLKSIYIYIKIEKQSPIIQHRTTTMNPETTIEELTKNITIAPGNPILQILNINYINELTNELTINIPEKYKQIIKHNIIKINWNKYFKRTCKEILKNGKICPVTVKPGYDYCQRHLSINLLRIQKDKLS